jgi:hypothetical protein
MSRSSDPASPGMGMLYIGSLLLPNEGNDEERSSASSSHRRAWDAASKDVLSTTRAATAARLAGFELGSVVTAAPEDMLRRANDDQAEQGIRRLASNDKEDKEDDMVVCMM